MGFFKKCFFLLFVTSFLAFLSFLISLSVVAASSKGTERVYSLGLSIHQQSVFKCEQCKGIINISSKSERELKVTYYLVSSLPSDTVVRLVPFSLSGTLNPSSYNVFNMSVSSRSTITAPALIYNVSTSIPCDVFLFTDEQLKLFVSIKYTADALCSDKGVTNAERVYMVNKAETLHLVQSNTDPFTPSKLSFSGLFYSDFYEINSDDASYVKQCSAALCSFEGSSGTMYIVADYDGPYGDQTVTVTVIDESSSTVVIVLSVFLALSFMSTIVFCYLFRKVRKFSKKEKAEAAAKTTTTSTSTSTSTTTTAAAASSCDNTAVETCASGPAPVKTSAVPTDPYVSVPPSSNDAGNYSYAYENSGSAPDQAPPGVYADAYACYAQADNVSQRV